MKLSELENKLIVDKNGEKIGKIIRIDMQSSVGDDDADYFAIIQIHHLIRRDHHFPMPINTLVVSQVDENTLRLEITKSEFKKMVKQYEADRKRRAKAAKMAKVSAEDEAIIRMIRRY